MSGPSEGTGWEIERRYLVRVDPGRWDAFGTGRRLRQGYVVAGPLTVRVRSGEKRGDVLTCKRGSGVRRREVETVIPPDVAAALFEAAGDRIIEKVRHRVGPWEIDRFEGSLEGLVLCEIELTHEEDPLPPPPDGISIVREVTDDISFTSSGLASMTSSAQRAWLSRIHGDRPTAPRGYR